MDANSLRLNSSRDPLGTIPEEPELEDRSLKTEEPAHAEPENSSDTDSIHSFFTAYEGSIGEEPRENQEPTQDEQENSPDTSASESPSNASQNKPPANPDFTVPAKSGADKLTQPFGLNKNEVNPLKAFLKAPFRQPVEAGRATTDNIVDSAANAGNTAINAQTSEAQALGTAGDGILAGQRGISAAMSGFNLTAASRKKARYTAQLNTMLKSDVSKFTQSSRKGQEEDKSSETLKAEDTKKLRYLPNESQTFSSEKYKPSSSHPQLDTLILTKDKKGNFQYDMDKVAKLAASKDPDLASEAMHAKNILLTDHIANQVAGKQKDRSTYNLVRNTIGTAGAAGAAVASHGGTVAAKAAGYSLAGVSGINVAGGIRTLKHQMRDSKANRIQSQELLNRRKFAETNKNGFTDPAVTETNPQTGTESEIYPSRTTAIDDVPPEALAASRNQLQEQARITVNKNAVFGGIFPSSLIDEKRTTQLKTNRNTEMADHATEVVKWKIGAAGPDKQTDLFAKTLQQSESMKSGDRDKPIEDLISNDKGFGDAYQLPRDMGGGKSESIQALRRTMEVAVEENMSADPTTAKLTGTEKFDAAKASKDVSKIIGAAAKRRES